MSTCDTNKKVTNKAGLKRPLEFTMFCNHKVLVVGGGIMGLGTAFLLSERGFQVTLLEKNQEVAKEASYINGSMICPSMCASWASLGLLAKNMGELRRIQLSWEAVKDHKFWRWGMWFTYNCLWPGRVERNHASQQKLGFYSLQCLQEMEEKYGPLVSFNKTATNTLRLFYKQQDLDDFHANSSQAKFWSQHGRPFVTLSAEKCRELVPNLGDFHPEKRQLVGGVINQPAIDSSGDIHQFCLNLKQLCLKNKVVIKTDAQVQEIQTQDNGKERLITGIVCQNGHVESADIYVLAVGVQSNPLGRSIGINLPIYPLKGNVITLPLKEPLEVNVYSPDHGSLICPLKPNLGRISGGVKAVGFSWSYETNDCQKVLDCTTGAYKQGYMDESKAHFFSGLRPVCADDIPIIGQTLIPNLYAITGHGSKGWTLSFGSCQLLADLIQGKPTKIDPLPYSPLRFHPFQSWLKQRGEQQF